MSLPGSQYFQFPADLKTVITEIKKWRAVYVSVDLGNGGVTDLVLLLLPGRRLLVGRRNFGGSIIECLEDLTYMLVDAQDGTNELKLTRGDSPYIIPSLMMMFTQIECDTFKTPQPTPSLVPASSSRPYISLSDTTLLETSIEKLVEETAQQDIIEFEVACKAIQNDNNSEAENDDIHEGDMNVYIVVVTRRFTVGDIRTFEGERYISLPVNDGFCAVICGVGSWAWKMKGSCYPVDDHYLIEKLSLWNLQGSPAEIRNLCKVFRALVPAFGHTTTSH